MSMRTGFIFMAVMACAAAMASANATVSAPPLALTADRGESSLGFHIKALEDPDGKWTIDDLLHGGLDEKFTPVLGRFPNYGHTRSAIWLKTQIDNTTTQPIGGALEAQTPWIDSLELYVKKPGGGYDMIRSGQRTPFAQRIPALRAFLFPLEFYPQESKTIYIRAQTNGPMALPMTFWRPWALVQCESGRMFYFGAFFGVLSLLIFRRAAVLWTKPETEGLYHLAYMAAGFMFAFTYNGLAAAWLWPGLGISTALAALLFGLALQIAAAQLTRSFLDLGGQWPRADRLLKAMILVWAAMALLRLTPLFPSAIDELAWQSMRLFMIPLALIAYVRLMSGIREARWMRAAWGLSLAGALVGVSSVTGGLAYSALGVKLGEVMFLAGAALAGAGLDEKKNNQAQGA